MNLNLLSRGLRISADRVSFVSLSRDLLQTLISATRPSFFTFSLQYFLLFIFFSFSSLYAVITTRNHMWVSSRYLYVQCTPDRYIWDGGLFFVIDEMMKLPSSTQRIVQWIALEIVQVLSISLPIFYLELPSRPRTMTRYA